MKYFYSRVDPVSRFQLHLFRMGCALFTTIWLSMGAIAQSGQTDAPKRMKVGIALEGGGALGLAHIGVLRWFEQHHIPVDYLSGNSMGGLVGGLYATGQSPDQIEGTIKKIDWPLLFGGMTPFEDLSFRRKEDARAVQSTLAIGFKKGAALPSGMNAGHQISLLIDRETLAYSDVKSFDDLPIPFRCVSTELVSGKAHVFSTGPIGLAMRATMSLPGIFAPVHDGNNLYVDGMFVDNLPTDLVRDMGPDVVIAIHLQVSPATAEDLQSLFGVLGRSLDISGAASEVRGMEAADIVVKVDVQKFTALDFTQADALIQKGMEAAEQKSKILMPYALDQVAWDKYLAQRDARKRGPVGIPQFIKVDGSTPSVNKKVEAFLQPMVNKPIDTKTLGTNLTRLTGTGRFSSASYGMTQNGDEIGLLVNVREHNNTPPVLQIGFNIDGTEPDNVTYTLGGRLTFLDVAGFGSEWRTDFAIGNTYEISSELYKKISQSSKWFVAPRVHASNAGQWIYSYDNPQADYRIGRAGGGVDLGYAIDRFSEVRAGYEIGYLDATLKLGTPAFSSVKGGVGATRFRFITDHLDEPIVPSTGYFGQMDFHWLDKSPGAPSAFPNLEMKTEFFKPISPASSIFLMAQGGTTMGYEKTGIPQYFLGGVPGLLAYGTNEVRGDQYFLFRPGYMHRLVALPPVLGGGVYAVALYEIGKMYNAPGVSKLPNDGAAGAIVRTAFGPVFIGGSVGDTGHATWFFSLGHIF
ncbi:MAG: patatin-like phospholipase family protein [Terracidiphilus sp.]